MPDIPREPDAPQRQASQPLTDAAWHDIFAAMVHELNNPLAAIMAHLEILRGDRSDDPVVAEHLDILIPQVERLAAILDRAMTFTRRGTEEGELVDIAASVKATVGLLIYHFNAHGISFDLDIPEDLPPVAARAGELQQVWLNYLTNAFNAIRRKDTTHGCVRIKARYDKNLRRVIVEIADNGIGMDRRKLKAVATTSEAGIGTAEAARIIAEQGGSVEFTSTPGKGTTVRVILPLATSRKPDFEEEAP